MTIEDLLHKIRQLKWDTEELLEDVGTVEAAEVINLRHRSATNDMPFSSTE
jgi:hypothetical protein